MLESSKVRHNFAGDASGVDFLDRVPAAWVS